MERRAPWRGLILPVVLGLALAAILVALGTWQLERLAWKEGLIARAAERPGLPPVEAPPVAAWPGLDLGELEYRQVRLAGRFLADHEALVFTTLGEPRGRFRGPGFWVMTPFELGSGGTVLVNRGFVPEDQRGAADREGPAPGAVTVTGLIRPEDERSWVTPEDRPEEGIYFARNTRSLAAGLRLAGPVAPFTVDLPAEATPASGLPQAGETRFRFTNNHLGYAVTWYGLAVSLVAVLAAVIRKRLPPETRPA